MDVCSVDLLVACFRISTGFKGDSVRETHLREHFGRTDKSALITSLKNSNVSDAEWPNRYSNPVVLHSVALRFQRFGGALQENRATAREKGPVAPTFSTLKGGCHTSSYLFVGVAVQGGGRSHTIAFIF